MSKIRVYKLAKELGKSSKELVNILNDLGVEVSSHMSTVEDETAELVKGMLQEEDKPEEKISKKEPDKKDRKKTKGKKQMTRTATQKEGTEHGQKDTDRREMRVTVNPPLSVKELAEKADIPVNRIIKTLIGLGVMATVNHQIDEEIVKKLIDKMNLKIKISQGEDKEEKPDKVQTDIKDKPEDLELRPPIVTVMGHVDHGKTTLLDVIRETRVAESEAGGITQHIGAYQAVVQNKKITFIDTPGHEAFTAMRARGARLTDIAILVVAADDGVMPQTVEAINHAKAADIPIIVAINKVDKSNAQPDMVKQQLTEHGLVPEDWGGDTICVPISALKKKNIDELLEMVLLVAEMEELKANPDRPAEGVIVESQLDKGRGPVATVLVKNGTLKVGDPILAGYTHGKVRAMINDQGKRIKEALPSTPVEVLGFSDVPAAGDYVQVLEDEKEARAIAEERLQKKQERDLQHDGRISLDGLYQQIKEGGVKELNLIIKGDVHGSIEALRESLVKLSTDEVTVNIIHTGVGAINETDVNLASASNAIIIGFNVRPDSNARKLAEREKVEIKTYRVIYKIIEDLKDAMAGMLEPELKEEVTGRAEVRATFKVPNVGTVAGLYVKEGFINRNNKVRLLRDGVVVYEGDIASLKRFKNDVREVKEGYECGLGIEGYNDIKEGDQIETYTYREIKRTL
ncbi:translation initiation factor IF-2 [Halothermothrix orenii]|uniref:Translation initiation factor IF-2 n=1 Tax=Halothermothrix orenii (strain H 168 / OCM 544 / DSM 9562) TaxID=373903 RepID=IF2_HALOH|nr:translation initiation factor IF-2 [Halothermothrix orenii]B8CW72.1 RecName: Full=Translation initiation factor IF-2 [Halothermothrix orenii H 168]ACL69541.1 translation initiation factor IF-2 [Halothermothrix orenii H 168]